MPSTADAVRVKLLPVLTDVALTDELFSRSFPVTFMVNNEVFVVPLASFTRIRALNIPSILGVNVAEEAVPYFSPIVIHEVLSGF